MSLPLPSAGKAAIAFALKLVLAEGRLPERDEHMTPQARLAAAAGILDDWLSGQPAEKLLTGWARRSRFAGSGDRAAICDHVFDAIRRRRSAAWLGGGETGRGLVIGMLRAAGRDPEEFLTGGRHALAPLTAAECVPGPQAPRNVRLDVPDWLEPALQDSLGAEFEPVMELMQRRAGQFLRVNVARTDRETVRAALAREGVISVPHALCDTALAIEAGARSLRETQAYREGLVELQDAASQAIAAAVPIPPDARVLDMCAGGGGKALALAARCGGEIHVHDGIAGRMADLPARAARAGARLSVLQTDALAAQAPFNVIVTDVPCSGSGAWRRQPEAKWRMQPADLERICALQCGILAQARPLVSPGGCIAYMTCSMLRRENEEQVEAFLLATPGWSLELSLRLSPLAGGDGFFLAILRAEPTRAHSAPI